MNGAVYISFFQGQLESVLEQVVQLAVQEISKTVGASLNSMLLETAVTDQENQRLKLKLQSRELQCKGRAEKNGSVVNGAREDNNTTTPARERTKQETHTPNVHIHIADTRRLEQKGRVVGQLKTVMERVLEFAVCELTKIVEASFEDLLLEITQKESEHAALEERLLRSHSNAQTEAAGKPGRGGATRRRGGSEHDPAPSPSPSGSEDAGDAPPSKVTRGKGHTDTTNDPDRQAVLCMAQDWVPIIDKVFGQKWCSDVWQIKELSSSGGGRSLEDGGLGVGVGLGLGLGLGLGSGSIPSLNALIREHLEPSPTSPQREPQWTPLEEMEVLSSPPDTQPHPLSSALLLLPTGDDSQLRSPSSMLHRLLTLPAQLLEDDEGDGAAVIMETLPSLPETTTTNATAAAAESPNQSGLSPPPPKRLREEEEDEEEEEEEDGGGGGEEEEEGGGRNRGRAKVKSAQAPKGRKAHECQECGKKFSRAPLLRAHHQQTHAVAVAAATVADDAVTAGPTPASSALRCPECGKRFSQSSRLQTHLRKHTGKRS